MCINVLDHILVNGWREICPGKCSIWLQNSIGWGVGGGGGGGGCNVHKIDDALPTLTNTVVVCFFFFFFVNSL